MPNIWLHLFICEDFLLFSVLYDCKLNIFRYWTAGQNKTFEDVTLGFWSIVVGFFHFLFYILCVWRLVEKRLAD